MEIFCPDCQVTYSDTAENLAHAEVNAHGRPTRCPKCKTHRIAVIYDIKKETDRKSCLRGEKSSTA
ncbi:MAG: hypothetical protein NTX82_00975 [Candidatus Parcubacteria bacterium]|nr:hypothetical protein [Candidatus Parcubacteria bacterium]